MRRAALIGAALTLLLAAVLWFVPYLMRERETVSSVPTPPPVVAVADIGLEPDGQACVDEVTFDGDSQVVELTALEGRRAGPALELSAEAGGYRAQTTLDGGYERPARLQIPLDPPAEATIGTLCVRNTGRSPVGFLATADARTSSPRSITRVDGVGVAPDLSVRLLAAESGTVVERAGELVDRAAAFKPALLGAWLLWIVLVLVAGGVVAGALYALGSSFRESG